MSVMAKRGERNERVITLISERALAKKRLNAVYPQLCPLHCPIEIYHKGRRDLSLLSHTRIVHVTHLIVIGHLVCTEYLKIIYTTFPMSTELTGTILTPYLDYLQNCSH